MELNKQTNKRSIHGRRRFLTGQWTLDICILKINVFITIAMGNIIYIS